MMAWPAPGGFFRGRLCAKSTKLLVAVALGFLAADAGTKADVPTALTSDTAAEWLSVDEGPEWYPENTESTSGNGQKRLPALIKGKSALALGAIAGSLLVALLVHQVLKRKEPEEIEEKLNDEELHILARTGLLVSPEIPHDPKRLRLMLRDRRLREIAAARAALSEDEGIELLTREEVADLRDVADLLTLAGRLKPLNFSSEYMLLVKRDEFLKLREDDVGELIQIIVSGLKH